MFEDFSPPEKGLNPSEEVVWNQRARMAARWMLGGACCIVGSPWVILLSYAALGATVGNLLLFIVLIGIFLTLVEFVNSRRTEYYLTTTRLIEVRGGLIRTEMPLEHFQGTELDDYFEVRDSHSESGRYFYSIRIRDPTSDKLMILTGLDEDAKEIVMKTIKALF